MTNFKNISTDNTLGGNSPSDDVVSSQKAIKDYVDSFSGANTSLSNLTVAGNNFCAHAGLPGTTYNNLTLGADGSVYLAPADGYFCLSVSSFGVDGVIFMYRSSPRYGLSTRYTPYDWVDICLPISKGEYVTIQYTGTPTVQVFRFLYANSAS